MLENIIDFEDKTALDLFAGTGAISFEFVSRDCKEVTCVEMANTQANFIKSVKQKLNAQNLRVIKGDVFKFVETCSNKFDIIFADPPYDHPRFGEIPSLILNSQMLNPGTLVIIEHSRDYDFSDLPDFKEQRTYGSVNFSIFEIA